MRKAWCGRFAVFPSIVVRSSFKESVAPNDTVFARGLVALSLQKVGTWLLDDLCICSCTHWFLEAPPTPAPLLAIDTVASSKLHAAAETIDAPESKSEDTKPKDTFMIDVCKRVNAELLSDARGQLTSSGLRIDHVGDWSVRRDVLPITRCSNSSHINPDGWHDELLL